MELHIITSENAAKIFDWLANRGGIAIWESLALGDPGSVTTPVNDAEGKPTTKPGWKYADKPSRIITSPEDVLVSKDVEVKRFRVGVRMGSNGFSIKVTDGGSRRIRKEISKAGSGAYHLFDYENQEAIIMKPESTTPLSTFPL